MTTTDIFLQNLTFCLSFLFILGILSLLTIIMVPRQYKKKFDFIEPLLFVFVYGFTYLTSPNLASRRKRLALLAAIIAPILIIGGEFFLLLR